MNYAESPENPLNMNTRGIEEWVKNYKEQERKAYHLISRPLPALATEAYARDVVNGVQIACKEVKRACERFLRDLERSRTDPDFMWRFDEAKAWRPIRFIEKKVAPSKGTIRRLVLQPWQHFVVGNLFGWVHKETGLRRFREALIFMGRKNGKTTLESGLADYMVGFDGENGANVYFLANSQKQSSILFKEAKNMIDSSPWLSDRFRTTRSEIRFPATNGSIVAMSAEKKDKDGENLHFGVFDEIHEYRDYSLINVMKRSRGTRTQPLIVYITTAGYVLDGPLADMIDQGEDCLKNYEDDIDERTFYFLCSLDDKKEMDDPRMWVKANPNIGLMDLAGMLGDYKKDRRSPKERADWMTKQFNLFAETDELSFISPETLKKNTRSIDIDTLEGRQCVGGFDLSETEDFTAACLEFPLDDGSVFFLEHSWVPQPRYDRDNNQERMRAWEEAGELTIIPKDFVDYEYVLDWYIEMAQKYDIVQINYDPAKALRLNKALEMAGFATNVTRQGAITLSGPMQNLNEMFLDGKVVFNNQSMFKWYVNNVRLIKDRNDNWLPSKTSMSRKIDGFAAALDAHTTVINMLMEPEDDNGDTSMFISFR